MASITTVRGPWLSAAIVMTSLRVNSDRIGCIVSWYVYTIRLILFFFFFFFFLGGGGGGVVGWLHIHETNKQIILNTQEKAYFDILERNIVRENKEIT